MDNKTDTKLYPKPVKQENFTVLSEFGPLYGTLDLPDKQEGIPVILIIAGSGPTDRDGNSGAVSKPNDSLKMLGGWLSEMGCAVLRYDKRGVGESIGARGDGSGTLFDAMIRDAVLWVELLKKDSRFTKIGILGHSEGSLIGMCTAKETEASFFISIAGAGRPIGRVIREQLEPQPGFVRRKALPILDELEEGTRVEKVPFYLKSLFNPEYQPYFISWNGYDPAAALRELEIPILIIQGSTDLQTNLKDAEILAAANPSARLEIIEGMNHILKTAPLSRIKNFQTYTRPGIPLTPELPETIGRFLAEVEE